MDKLSTCRNEARKVLFRDLFFVVEKIASYDSPELAQQDGFGIAFKPERAPSVVNIGPYPQMRSGGFRLRGSLIATPRRRTRKISEAET